MGLGPHRAGNLNASRVMVNAIGSAVLIFAVWTFNIVFGRICDIGTANLARAVATVNYKLRPASQLELRAVKSRSEGE